MAQMRQQLRPNAFLRMIENQFVSSQSGFVDKWPMRDDQRLANFMCDKPGGGSGLVARAVFKTV